MYDMAFAPVEADAPATVAALTAAATVEGGRDSNEDAVKQWCQGRCAVTVVADGVGGEPWGEVASELASSEAMRFVRRAIQYGVERGLSVPVADIVVRAFAVASRRLQREAEQTGRPFGMRTTLLIAVVVGDQFTYAYLGDGGMFVYDPAAAVLHDVLDPMRDGDGGPLTGTVGPQNRGAAVVGERRLAPGSVVLSTTDGLADLMTPAHWTDLAAALANDARPDATLQQLLTHCASMHHDNLPVFTDNLTISLIRVMP